jgi:hypothetical protein
MDAQRAMREARYAQRAALVAPTAAQARTGEASPQRAGPRRPPSQPGSSGRTAVRPSGISGRTHTREQGHTAKSHRYS